MTIVTFTSDFGEQDYYVAIIKGAMLCQQSQIQFIDITHNVKNYDIVQAAFIFKNAWQSFPEGSIHLLSINDFDNAHQGFLLIKHNGHYFIGPDNGLFWLVFEKVPDEVYELPKVENSNFPLKDIYANAVAHVTTQKPLPTIGNRLQNIVQRIALQAVTSKAHIRGSVVHIDNFENVIVNINKALFDKIGKNRPFSLYFKRHDPITQLSQNYYDVPIGEILCRFNSADCIEIAINMGKAASLLGLNVEDVVQIDFH
jgi:S-adenosylmethionine hydrolase